MKEKSKESLIIESGKKLFWKFWVKKVSIDMIVGNAWIAKGTFYLYFRTKIELYKYIIDQELVNAEKQMQKLFQSFPDIKERFVSYLIWSIHYFKNNAIIRNMVLWNNNYYIWGINIEYLEKWHNKMLKILLKDTLWKASTYKLDNDKIDFLSKLIWNFKQILLIENKCFKTEKEFLDFALEYAKVLVNWFFSDYQKIGKNHKKSQIYKIIS